MQQLNERMFKIHKALKARESEVKDLVRKLLPVSMTLFMANSSKHELQSLTASLVELVKDSDKSSPA